MKEINKIEKMLLCWDIHLTKYTTWNIWLRYRWREYISKNIKWCIENMQEVLKFFEYD